MRLLPLLIAAATAAPSFKRYIIDTNDFVEGMFGDTLDVMAGVPKFFISSTGEVIDLGLDSGRFVADMGTALVDVNGNIISDIFDNIEQAVDDTQRLAGSLVDTGFGAAKGVGETGFGAVKGSTIAAMNLGGDTVDFAGNVLDATVDVLKGTGNFAKNMLGAVGDLVSLDPLGAIDAVADAHVDLAKDVIGATGDIAGASVDLAEDAFDFTGDVIDVAGGVVQGGLGVASRVVGGVTDAAGIAQDLVFNGIDGGAEIFGDYVPLVGGPVEDVLKLASGAVRGVAEKATDISDEIATGGIELVGKGVDETFGLAGDTLDGVGKLGAGLANASVDAVEDVGNAVVGVAGGVVDGATDVVEETFDFII